MWIVKLGGSLSRDARLPRWLRMLAELGRGRVVVVPGGAAFADAVRAAQGHWGFDDLTAHNMAVLAMAQTAHMLHALEPRLALAWRALQVADIESQVERVASTAGLAAAAPVVGAGCGAFLAADIARRTGRPFVRFSGTMAPGSDAALAAWVDVCAPAVAVAALAHGEA